MARQLGYIYLLRNPIGQIYIGQTKDLDRRMQRYRDLDCASQKLIYVSLIRYGFENHSIQILKRCAYSKLDFWEIKFINEYQSCYRDNRALGLNILKESYAEYCQLQATRNQNRRNRAIPIVQLTMSGAVIKSWKSIATATKKLKIKSGNISKALKGEIGSAGGFKWRYE